MSCFGFRSVWPASCGHMQLFVETLNLTTRDLRGEPVALSFCLPARGRNTSGRKSFTFCNVWVCHAQRVRNKNKGYANKQKEKTTLREKKGTSAGGQTWFSQPPLIYTILRSRVKGHLQKLHQHRKGGEVDPPIQTGLWVLAVLMPAFSGT